MEHIHGVASPSGSTAAGATSTGAGVCSTNTTNTSRSRRNDGDESRTRDQTRDPDKTPKEVKKYLTILELEISLVRAEQRSAFDVAANINPKYANNTQLRMMMLRTADWNSKEAALSVCKHFEVKLEVFGIEKLVCDIEFDDLPADAQLSLRAGSFFCSHHCKDRAGRLVLVENYSKWKYTSIKSHVQAYWWVMMNCLARISPKTHGCGMITIALTRDPAPTPYLISDMFDAVFLEYDMKSCIPIKGRRLHVFAEGQGWPQAYHFMFLKAMSKFVRLGLLTAHFGSLMETIHELDDYDVRVKTKWKPELLPSSTSKESAAAMKKAYDDKYRSALPIDENGEIQLDVVRDYIQYSLQDPPSLMLPSLDDDDDDDDDDDASLVVLVAASPSPPPVQYNGNNGTTSFGLLSNQTPFLHPNAAGVHPNNGNRFFPNANLFSAFSSSMGNRFLQNSNAFGTPAVPQMTWMPVPPAYITTNIVPTQADILSGRGPTYRDHPGNAFMAKLLAHYKSAHDAATSPQKTNISAGILQLIKGQRRRFLERRENTGRQKEMNEWVEMSDEKAQKKIATGFRNLTKKMKTSASLSVSSSSA